MKPRKQATKDEIKFIRNNAEMRSRDLANQLGLLQSVVTYWLKFTKTSIIVPKPRKAIKQVSNKMKDRLAKYQLAKKSYNVANCEICGNLENLSIHHIAGRSGKLLYDHSNFLLVCMAGSTHLNTEHPESNQTEGCHPWIERNLKLARELGYSKSKIKSNENQ